MSNDSAENGDHRVIDFRRGRRNSAATAQEPRPLPRVDDLRDFERTDEPDDYRHRVLTNVAAAVVTLLLIIAGLWLADALSVMRKNQDCVLSGRRGCTTVEVPVQPRGDISSPQIR